MPHRLAVPVVLAPLAGGPSTPALAAAVSDAGGLGFLGAGYRAPEDVRQDIARLRALTGAPFGVNVFAPPGRAGDPEAVRRYAEAIRPEAERAGVAPGEPRHDDDAYAQKLELLAAEGVAVVSFTFGCPEPRVAAGLRAAGASVWVTVTGPDEAALAERAGADALVVQGAEAGGHRGSFDDRPGGVHYGLLALLQLVRSRTTLPMVAAGGIATGRGLAAALAAGAAAGQAGTAFMRCPEAGTPPAQRQALAGDTPTELTRAFTGRLARGLRNRFLVEHRDQAPAAYPEVHHLTAPLRARARQEGDAGGFNLWAGEAHALAQARPAAEVVARLAAEAREALAAAAARLA